MTLSKKESGGVGVTTVLAIVLLVLKLTGVAKIGYGVIALVFFAPALLALVIIVAAFVASIIAIMLAK